jgi:PAS domain-containing protein
VIHTDDQERIKQILDKANQDKALYSFETRITRPDGTERDIWVEAGEMVLDDHGELIASSGIVQDITEKKKAEREIRKSENLLQKIYELLPVGLWITDKSGKLILVAQDEFQVFHGRRLPSGEEIKPHDWASVHTINEGVTIRDEMIEIDAYDGKTKTILNYTTPILSESGEMEGAIVLNLDISELKNAERQLSNQLDELRRWNLATLGRENRIRDLKMEINELLAKQGLPPKYQSVTGEDHE